MRPKSNPKFIVPIFVLAAVFSSCRKDDCMEPGAYFTCSGPQFVGDTIKVDPSGSPHQYSWDSHGTGIFVESNSTTCTGVNAPHMVLVPGNNILELIVTSDCGARSTHSVAFTSQSHYSGSWSGMTPMSFGRSYGVSFVIGTNGYVATGHNSNSQVLNDLWEWDQSTNTWSSKSSLPGPSRVNAIGFSCNGKGYVGMGSNGQIELNDIWEWDQTTDTWTQKNNYPGTGRVGVISATAGNYVYVGTGEVNSSTVNDFWRYDPSTDSWLQLANFGGNSIATASAFSVNNKIYVCGGYTTIGQGCADVWEYDIATDQWTSKSPMPHDAYGACAFSLSNKGYICCGFSSSSFGNLASRSVFEYDPSTDTWNYKHVLSGYDRIFPTGFSIGSFGYLATGLTYFGKSAELWEFTP